MMGMTLNVRSAQVDKGLNNLSKLINHTHDLNKQLGIAGVRWVLKNFQREGEPKWKRLLPATANARIRPGSSRRRGSSHVLVSTGMYRASFASNATARSVRIGSPWKISIVHEEGRGNMPKRMALPTRRQVRDEIINPITNLHVAKSIKKSGLKLKSAARGAIR